MKVIFDTSSGRPWIGVDFDQTLAKYEGWHINGTNLGTPIPLMVERVKRWLAQGMDVRILTARVAHNSRNRELDQQRIREWCLKHLGVALEVTAEKDFNMVALWDDRAVAVEANTGEVLHESETDPLTVEEEMTMAWEFGHYEKDGR